MALVSNEENQIPSNTIKIVVIGDRGVGKTSLLIKFTTNEFPGDYIPPVIDNHEMMIKNSKLNLCDTCNGHPDYHSLRPLAFLPHTDIFVILFSKTSLSSFQNVTEVIVPEIKKYCRKTPFVLVGAKMDLTKEKEEIEKLLKEEKKPVTFEEGEKLCQEIKAEKYLECSAKTGEGVKEVFDSCIQTFLNLPPVKNKRKRCCLL